MSVLVSSSTNIHSHYFSNQNASRNISVSPTPTSTLTQCLTSKAIENHHQNGNIENDHVPFGVVNSMKQRLLDKVNESLLSHNSSMLAHHSVSKTSARLASNENLLYTKTVTSPLKRMARLSRSQDNLLNNNAEQYASYIEPKQDVVIVERTRPNDHKDVKIHRYSYSELNLDEVPKPGTVTTVKNMFERQIRLSRYDCDRLQNISNCNSARTNNQHRDMTSRSRSRSISPNDMALRQRRTTTTHTSTVPSTSASSQIPSSTSYPDLVISHTPTTLAQNEPNKVVHESVSSSVNILNDIKRKNLPLSVISDEAVFDNVDINRENLLISTNQTANTVEYKPLDFKSRLALFNHTSTIDRSSFQFNIPANIKKPTNSNNTSASISSFLIRPVLHHHHYHHTDKKESSIDSVVRAATNSATSVTFFGGVKVNGNDKTALSTSLMSSPVSIVNEEQPSITIDLPRAPDIIGGNIKLNKSSIYSGTKKESRVQFIDNVATFEYPSFNVAMAEFNQRAFGDEDGNDSDSSLLDSDKDIIKILHIEDGVNDLIEDVDDDELERLANINAQFNSKNLRDESLQSKGSLHTFRPTYLDRYELGTSNKSSTNSNPSDNHSREKYFSVTGEFSNHSIYKPTKSIFDMTNNIQWSSMSTNADLLF